MTKSLIHGNAASPAMVSPSERMAHQKINQAQIDQEIRQGLRPASRFGMGTMLA